jgi:hypothetical protein
MQLEDIIMELYRLAETRQWEGVKTDQSLFAAIESLEKIWELQQADKKRTAMALANKKQPRLWC